MSDDQSSNPEQPVPIPRESPSHGASEDAAEAMLGAAPPALGSAGKWKPPAQARGIADRVCEALACAHSHGVIHRNIKPSNVMIEADGTVKVADFGLAKLATRQDAMLTSSSVSVGTFDFMTPEALHGSGNADHRADLYAVGVMLYQMLTGKI